MENLRANESFLNQSLAFWAHTKIISEKLGYSKDGSVKKYIQKEVIDKLRKLGIEVRLPLLINVIEYLNYRADILNEIVKNKLMNIQEAREQFNILNRIYTENNYTCTLPFNKQKGEKKGIAYFTAIINILAEKTLREFALKNNLVYGSDVKFNYNPYNLSYFTDENKNLQASMSRRFDGVIPDILNPIAIWEIKEYYFTTTFGSRIADGVFETQLDGYEINTISRETGRNIEHIYFIDDYHTWWDMGKSYLCRIIDMLHEGLVDEVMFGKEVLERWPDLIHEILTA